jgi:hypothetical protein
MRAPRTFVVAATGPSLTLAQARAVALAKRSDKNLSVVTVNDAVYPMWWADVAYACDGRWWIYHHGLPGFRGMKVRLKHIDGTKDINEVPFDDIDTVESSGPDGADFRPGYVRTGGNSGYQAIQLAVHLGAERIILLGFDMNPKRFVHWFGDHPNEIRNVPNVAGWVRRYDGLAEALNRRGIDVVNSSPDTALAAFPRVDLVAALQGRRP